MTSEPDTIGPYTVESELGRGGMGVVFLATDPRLGRKVAVKALPEHFADDPERLARFEREARTLAALNHPNVAGIHGVEEHDGRKYLVLEYVEGETLADRLDRGPLPVDEALEICAEVAAGLEAAHEAGVIHRDLKPANIRITPEGKAKILDFGLARSEEATSSGSSVSQMPTLTTPHSPTTPGAILGTAPYMSPEQARGRKVDKRSDIWSFGVVLYECLTGIGPFHGETATDSIGAILHKDVDLALLPRDAPRAVRHVLTRCLQRDKSLRYRDIGDARLDLSIRDSDSRDAPDSEKRRGVSGFAVVAIVLLVAAGAWIVGGMSSRPAEAPTLPLSVAIPKQTPDGDAGEGDLAFDVSAARREVVFVGRERTSRGGTRRCLFVRSLNSRAVRKIPGSEHATVVSVFPDGRHVLFAWDDPDSSRFELRRAAIDGGPVVTLLASDAGPGYDLDTRIAWRSPTSFLVIGGDRTKIYEYSLETSETSLLIDVAQVFAGAAFVIPQQLLDDGETMLCTIAQADPQRGPVMDLFLVNFKTSRATRLLNNTVGGELVDNDRRLVFQRDGALCVARFDASQGVVVGEITPVIASVWDFRITPSGDLYYVDRPELDGGVRPVLVGDDGERSFLIETPMYLLSEVHVSPDGRLVGITSRPEPTGPPEAKIIDVETGFINPLLRTNAPTSSPVWMHDGDIAFAVFSSFARMEIQRVRYGVEQSSRSIAPVGDEGGVQFLPTFSPDGRWMAYQFAESLDAPTRDIYIAPIDGDSAPRPLVESDGVDTDPAYSPDGSLLAYSSDSAGEFRVVLRAFDTETGNVGARVHPVSLGAGRNPAWSPDGQYLYFVSGNRNLMRVRVETEPSLTISSPEIAIEASHLEGLALLGNRAYAVMPDGERFLFLEEQQELGSSAYINLTIGWLDEVRERFPISD